MRLLTALITTVLMPLAVAILVIGIFVGEIVDSRLFDRWEEF
jgi:hypothetical protein